MYQSFIHPKEVNNTEAVVSVGDKIKVKVDSIENGKVSLSPVERLRNTRRRRRGRIEKFPR